MRAANPLSSPEAAVDKRTYEPSMEEILASIRRIIADDQTLPSARPRLTSDTIDNDASGEMTVSRIERRAETALLRDADPVPSASNSERAPSSVFGSIPEPAASDAPIEREPANRYEASEDGGVAGEDGPSRAAPRSAPASEQEADKDPLFSADTDAAVSSAFKMLAASRLADNSDEIMTLAREMIRPLLRTWIDDHLPGMVERMVRAEIERVARGGR